MLTRRYRPVTASGNGSCSVHTPKLDTCDWAGGGGGVVVGVGALGGGGVHGGSGEKYYYSRGSDGDGLKSDCLSVPSPRSLLVAGDGCWCRIAICPGPGSLGS